MANRTKNGKPLHKENRLSLYKRKGWKGFVHGYQDWIRATEDEGRWDAVEWGEDGDKSGAKEIEREGALTIYRY
jgi:hypothetical protein